MVVLFGFLGVCVFFLVVILCFGCGFGGFVMVCVFCLVFVVLFFLFRCFCGVGVVCFFGGFGFLCLFVVGFWLALLLVC